MTALRKPPVADPQAVDRIAAALDDLSVADLEALGVWKDLAELSSRTELEAIGTDEAGIVLHGDTFEAVADLYLLLNYGGPDDADDLSMSETVLATIRGKVTDTDIAIDEMLVDTSSFYA